MRARYISQTFHEKLEIALRNDHSAHGMDTEQFLKKLEAEVSTRHAVWATRMYCAQQYKVEDFSKIKDEIKLFNKVRMHLAEKDLNRYKTLSALYDATGPFADAQATLSSTAIKREEATTILDMENIKVVVPLTHAASCLYGAGTKWCTASKDNPDTFDSYSKQGLLYILLIKEGEKHRKFQLHYETSAFMDERDCEVSSADIKMLSGIPGYTKFLNMLIEKHYLPHILANKPK